MLANALGRAAASPTPPPLVIANGPVVFVPHAAIDPRRNIPPDPFDDAPVRPIRPASPIHPRPLATRADEMEAALIEDEVVLAQRGYSPENHGTGLLAKALGRGRSQDDTAMVDQRPTTADRKRRWSADESESENRNKRGILAMALSNREPIVEKTARSRSPPPLTNDFKPFRKRTDTLEMPKFFSKKKRPSMADSSRPSSSAGSETGENADELDKGKMTLAEIMKLEPSTRLLYLAKKSEWKKVEELLQHKIRFDFTLSDVHGFNALLLAVRDSKVDIFNQLLHKNADFYSIAKDRRTVAHIAAMYATDEMMRVLIQRKVDLNKPAGPKGQLPIHYACSRSSPKAVGVAKVLLEQRDFRMFADLDDNLPIHHAVRHRNSKMVHLLLDSNAEAQLIRPNAVGDLPLHLSCRNGDREITQMITTHGGALPNAQNADGRTPLHEVVASGDAQLLKLMHRLHADANIRDKDEKTPLHVAAERGHHQMAEFLVDKFRSSIMARTKDGNTLLHVAALSGDPTTTLVFLKRGVPLFMPNRLGALGLHAAAAAGFNEVVKMLIAKGTSVDVRTKDNYTSLHVAVQSGKALVVETLLGNGADVHVKGGQLGETALHLAASLTGPEAVDCAQMLLKSGAQVDVPRADGETCLHIAARSGYVPMIRLLLYEIADATVCSQTGETALHVASKNCNFAAAEILLQRISEMLINAEAVKRFVNMRSTTEGMTSVHYACIIRPEQQHYASEDTKLINLLIDYGGDVAVQTITTQETAMHMASRSGNQAVLLAMAAKMGAGNVQIVQNKQSKSGWSPLLEACANGHMDVASVLLEHHARIDVFDETGKTALHLAASNGHLQLTNLLLRYKAFVNSKTKDGETPLHLASQNGHVKVVQMLVQEHGAALEATTLEVQTALHYAARFGQLAVNQVLLQLSANPNARDAKGQTPLHLAAENDHPDVVKMFLKMRANNRAVLTATDHSGFTCAHIAAMKGSIAVVKELMMIDKAMVIHAKTKGGLTSVHYACIIRPDISPAIVDMMLLDTSYFHKSLTFLAKTQKLENAGNEANYEFLHFN